MKLDFSVIKKIIVKISSAKERFFSFLNGLKKINFQGLANNPLFCFAKNKHNLKRIKGQWLKKISPFKNGKLSFGLVAVFLFLALCSGCNRLASLNGFETSHIVFFSSFFNNLTKSKDSYFISQSKATELETPDLKIIQDNTLGGVSTPYIVSTKVLGDVFGGNSKNSKVIIEYEVQAGDTIQSIADLYGIDANTLMWANDLTSSSKIKVGQSLVILPTDGVLHMVESGDTMTDIAKTYSSTEGEIISYNELANEDDIYIGDILIIPSGVMPKKASSTLSSASQVALADNYFIYPTYGIVTQGLHYYNAIDVANNCGTPIYAAASGTVQRVKYGYNFGGGNLVTILHQNGTVTYYGHLMTIFVQPGDVINVGDRIALMGGGTGTVGDGLSTGCHLHFQVMGAKNPLSVYPIGTTIKMK